jgi:hypothetical protein
MPTKAPTKKSAAKSPAAARSARPAAGAYKAGQTLRLTITRAPTTVDAQQTVLRLMRQDPAIKKALRAGQELRMGRLIVRSRGGRPWEVREKSAKVARPTKGASWSMRYFPQIAGDLHNVARFVEIKAG